jgi:hypothetical protein
VAGVVDCVSVYALNGMTPAPIQQFPNDIHARQCFCKLIVQSAAQWRWNPSRPGLVFPTIPCSIKQSPGTLGFAPSCMRALRGQPTVYIDRAETTMNKYRTLVPVRRLIQTFKSVPINEPPRHPSRALSRGEHQVAACIKCASNMVMSTRMPPYERHAHEYPSGREPYEQALSIRKQRLHRCSP